ncbi:MAG: hypothetical protein HGA24_01400, partial [Candidatus Aminicenantes bacterium]|nr:hypothetical protein [Candidatus Aminicenantes bacterium]
ESRERGLAFATPEELREGWAREAGRWMTSLPLRDLPVMREFLPGYAYPELVRVEENKIYQVRYQDAVNYEVADRFTAFARERGFDPAALAVAWTGSHPAVTAPIVGARDTAQLAAVLGAAAIPMTPELRAEISALSPEPASATDRNEERTAVNFGVR